ncbi:uncharacterized protein EAE98_000216 [Botrytis deweyae]|uniref:Uncharacterized protein n=1 Tax=Botrytis deweyae TaxID=2478750 RepID=A0ABQ7J215_9HELO|nr:uncharacterized protein EAE98_000216 [Botrytis deweyae]KAF7940089.1 hypothetical protein EAE98_000216 [Botrytis deweyae]
MRGIVMIRGHTYVQLLDEINIKDPEAIRRVIRQAVTLPPIDEVTRQGIKGCVSGPISSLLGTSTLSLTWVEQQAANDIQKLWKRGERYQVHIKRLIQDCDVTKADFLVVKGVESARKLCLQAQDEERQNEEHRKRVRPESNEYQDLPDEEYDQNLPQTPNDAFEGEKRNVTGHLRERTTPNKKQKRKQSVIEHSPTRSTSSESQDFENQENQNEFTHINKPGSDGISYSKKQAGQYKLIVQPNGTYLIDLLIESGKPNNTPGTRMVNSLRDHNAPAVDVTKSPDKSPVRRTRNSTQMRGENSWDGSNEIVPSPQVDSPRINIRGSQNPSNASLRELADYNERGAKEKKRRGRPRRHQPVEQQPELINDGENDIYTPEPQIPPAPYKKKVGRGGARRGPAWEKRKAERENDARSSNHKSQDDQPGSESNPIGIEDGSDNETVVYGQLDNQEEDVKMEDVQ